MNDEISIKNCDALPAQFHRLYEQHRRAMKFKLFWGTNIGQQQMNQLHARSNDFMHVHCTHEFISILIFYANEIDIVHVKFPMKSEIQSDVVGVCVWSMCVCVRH